MLHCLLLGTPVWAPLTTGPPVSCSLDWVLQSCCPGILSSHVPCLSSPPPAPWHRSARPQLPLRGLPHLLPPSPLSSLLLLLTLLFSLLVSPLLPLLLCLLLPLLLSLFLPPSSLSSFFSSSLFGSAVLTQCCAFGYRTNSHMDDKVERVYDLTKWHTSSLALCHAGVIRPSSRGSERLPGVTATHVEQHIAPPKSCSVQMFPSLTGSLVPAKQAADTDCCCSGCC